MGKFYNTGIFNDNTKLKETQDKNNDLMKLYKAWFSHMEEEGISKITCKSQFNGMHLLTCFDSFINRKNKIMTYGKEANSQEGNIDIFNENYQKDAYYSYDYAIINSDKTDKKYSNNTFFLKTRKLISGIDSDDTPSEGKVLSILNNNLNKTSLMGKYTPCYYGKKYRGSNEDFKNIFRTSNNQIEKTFEEIIYSPFKTPNGFEGTVFIHELNILRPTHLIFLCGKGYNNHIKRDFGENFFDIVKKNIYSLNINDAPVSKPVKIERKKIKELFGIDNYGPLNILFAIHPSAHMTSKTRKDTYEKSIEKFCKE